MSGDLIARLTSSGSNYLGRSVPGQHARRRPVSCSDTAYHEVCVFVTYTRAEAKINAGSQHCNLRYSFYVRGLHVPLCPHDHGDRNPTHGLQTPCSADHYLFEPQRTGNSAAR